MTFTNTIGQSAPFPAQVSSCYDCIARLKGQSFMVAEVVDRHIEIIPGVASGKPHIVGHRITVQNIVIWHERMGKSADDICAEYDLHLADVYAALTYYFDHRDEIDQSIEESEAFVDALRARTPSVLVRKLKTHRSE